MAVVSGGTTLIDNGALDAAVPTGSLILLSTQTASSSASIEFTSGIDSTYDSYVFKFIDIHPATDGVNFQFQGSTNGGSSYGVTITSTAFYARHYESNAAAGLAYSGGWDLAQSTNYQYLTQNLGNDNDQSTSGTLQIFNPSSDTFVKHFIATADHFNKDNIQYNSFFAGYFNTSSALNAFDFEFSSGNIDDGIIKMYGVK